ncbi:MAG: FGGY-family carbohydrate kinase [Planctomycetota bacterium]|jgi:L-xylulokinase
MAKYLIGTDNGLTMTKAAVFDLDGKEIAVASRKSEWASPNPGWYERDMASAWKAAAESIKEAVKKAKIDPGDVACVSCAGHGNGAYLIDKDGNPVRPAISANDGRAKSYIDKWLADGVNLKALPKTTQCLWPGQPNAILSWLRDNEPENLKKADWLLMCKDWIRYKLTGNVNAELTDWSGCSVMNVVTGKYDDEVLEIFGMQEMQRLFPEIKLTADICGEVTAAAAKETGLKKGTPVAGGMFDIDACGLSSGIIDERQMSLVAGTWGNNQYIAKEPLVDKDLFMTSCYSIPGYYLMLEGSPTSASNLEWFVTEFMGAEKEKAEKAGKSVYDVCNELVAGIKPEEVKFAFLPFLYGSNAHPDGKACFVGLDGGHTRAHVIRAIYEGIVFGHNWHVQRLLQFRDPPASIQFTGGAGRSEIWVQMFADCFQIPIEIPSGTELGALGAAIAGAVAARCHPGYKEAVEAMVSMARRQEPDPGKKDLYAEKFERYKKVIAALEPVWGDVQP